MIKRHFYILSFLFICIVPYTYSQATYSPYSVIGLGEIENRDYGRTSGMSNLAIGVRGFDYLNPTNPAGISGVDSLKFIFDVSASVKQSFFKDKHKSDNAFNGNLKKISLGFRLKPRWGISLGMKPFSDVGYRIYSSEPVEGSNLKKSVYLEGSGGLYEIYLSNGIRITDNLSLGLNTKFISGSIKQTENHTDYLFEKSSNTSMLYNTFGLQYHRKRLTLGATYGYKQRITMKNKTSIYDSSYKLMKEESDKSTNQFIPETFGLGFSHDSKKILWGMDFQYQKWNGLKTDMSGVKIVDSYKVSAGLGYIPRSDRYYRVRTQGQMQVGASISKSYIQVSEKNAYHYSVSTGFSLPVDKGGVLLNIGLEYGNVLSAPSNYIKESYFMVTLNCNVFEQWFKKRRID